MYVMLMPHVSCLMLSRCHLHPQNASTDQRLYSWIGMETCAKWWVRRCLKYYVRWSVLLIPLPNSPGISAVVNYFEPLPIAARGNSYILLFTDHFSRRADLFAVTAAEFTTERIANIPMNRYTPLRGYSSILLSIAQPLTAVYKLLRVHKLTTSVYHSSGN